MRLPIAEFRGQILKAVKENPVVILTAETGAGKSTQVPQYLLQQGYEVVVTQPRRLAARTVAARVAQEWGSRLGGMVGFQTAFEKQKCATTRCLFVTDGLALVHELIGRRKPNTVLVIDEGHERNINIDTLMAYTHKRLQAGELKDLKVIIMSATIDAKKLSTYFGGAPVIEVPGRGHDIYPVDTKTVGDEVDAAILCMRERFNTLFFVAGKKDITRYTVLISERLEKENLKAKILPLHGECTPAAQQECFESFSEPKLVIATNVAQTSVTIPDIRAVIDTGMEMRNEMEDGIDGLHKKPISWADMAQRKGRGGRCGKSLYFDYCPKNASDRLDYPKPEILRSLLDGTVLRLAAVGLDAESLTFPDQPDPLAVKKAKRSLQQIGCLDENDRITEVGKAVNAMPINGKYARIVVEGKKLGVLDDAITIAAILEVQGITDRKGPWRLLCAGEQESDLLAQLAIFNLCEDKNAEWMKENGVFVKSYFRAKEVRRHLVRTFGKEEIKSTGDRNALIRAVCTGLVEHIFTFVDGRYVGQNGKSRKLSNYSVVFDGERWVVGLPFDLDTQGDGYVFSILSMVSIVELRVLEEIAPHVFSYVKSKPYYDEESGKVVSTTTLFFGGKRIGSKVVEDSKHPDAAKIIAEAQARRGQWRRRGGKCPPRLPQNPPPNGDRVRLDQKGRFKSFGDLK